jgi:hypothetical protein
MIMVEESEDVLALKRLWPMLMSAALHEKTSVDFIVKVAQSWAVP